MVPSLNKAGLFFRTIGRLPLRQLIFRAVRIFKMDIMFPVFGSLLFPLPENINFSKERITRKFLRVPESLLRKFIDPPEGGMVQLISSAEAILAGQIKLLNQETHFQDKIDWAFSPKGDPLWSFNLHYFDWAAPLLFSYHHTKDRKYKEKWLDLAQDWMENNPPGKGAGWHPYPLSRRMQSWIKAGAFLSHSLGETLPKAPDPVNPAAGRDTWRAILSLTFKITI